MIYIIDHCKRIEEKVFKLDERDFYESKDI